MTGLDLVTSGYAPHAGENRYGRVPTWGYAYQATTIAPTRFSGTVTLVRELSATVALVAEVTGTVTLVRELSGVVTRPPAGE